MPDDSGHANYVRYQDSVEIPIPNEETVIAELAATMRHLSEVMNDRFRHAMRSVHAKSHGLLKGTLTVVNDLPEPFRQGLFRTPATYPVIMRFSTNPGDILPDSISTPRGLAIKVVGIQNAEMLPEHAGQTTQDFVCVNAKTFQAKDVAAFLEQVKLLAKHATDSTALKQAVSSTARTAETVLEAFGGESATLKGFGHPETHILGETFGSLAAIRYGDYIAKFAIAPGSENLKALTGQHLDVNHAYSALRDAVVEFFRSNTAVWDLQAQLCTDLSRMPVEDPSVKWPEEESPYVTVARLTVEPQEAYSDARRVYVDEQLTFNPWHALAAHRPLGNIMRARHRAYAASSQYRHAANGRAAVEPKDLGDLPE